MCLKNAIDYFGVAIPDLNLHDKAHSFCGGRGCLTTIASIESLELRSSLSYLEIKKRIQGGDEQLERLLEQSIDVIANMVSNPGDHI